MKIVPFVKNLKDLSVKHFIKLIFYENDVNS